MEIKLEFRERAYCVQCNRHDWCIGIRVCPKCGALRENIVARPVIYWRGIKWEAPKRNWPMTIAQLSFGEKYGVAR